MRKKALYQVFLAVIFPFLFMLLSFYSLMQRENNYSDLLPETTKDILCVDGSRLNDVPASYMIHKGDTVIVHIPIPEKERLEQATLCFRVNHSYLTLYDADGRVLYRYGPEDNGGQQYFGTVFVKAPIPESSWGRTMTLVCEPQYSMVNVVSGDMLIMKATESWKYTLMGSSPFLILYVTLIVIFSGALVVMAARRKRSLLLWQGRWLSVFCVSFAVWSLGYYGLMNIFPGGFFIKSCLEYASLYLVPVAFCRYLFLVEQVRVRRRIYRWFFRWFAALFIFSVVMQVLDIITLNRILPVLHLSLSIACLTVCWHKFHPVMAEKIQDIISRYGILVMLVSMILVLSHHYISSFFLQETFDWTYGMTPFGMLVFILTMALSYGYRLMEHIMTGKEKAVLRHLAYHDNLTDLSNRAGCFKYAETLGADAVYAVIFMDLNELKATNDRYGHAIGNKLLRSTAEILLRVFGEKGHCSRMGGDEFVVIVPDATKECIDAACGRVNDLLAGLARDGIIPLKASISYGISMNDPEAPASFEELLNEADNLMYANKAEYKGSFRKEINNGNIKG